MRNEMLPYVIEKLMVIMDKINAVRKYAMKIYTAQN